MIERHYPTEEQLLRLHSFLRFLKKDKMFWRTIEMRGGTIVIKAEPPKGEIDIRVFYIYESGELDDDEFRN